MDNLGKLMTLQMGGFIVFELVAYGLVAGGLLPSSMVIKQIGSHVLQLNITYMMIAGFIAVLVSAIWVVLLVEANVVKIEKIDIKLW